MSTVNRPSGREKAHPGGWAFWRVTYRQVPDRNAGEGSDPGGLALVFEVLADRVPGHELVAGDNLDAVQEDGLDGQSGPKPVLPCSVR